MTPTHLKQEGSFYRHLFHLILVVSLQNILAYSVNVADNIMLGSYSQAALSGAATVNQIQFLVQQITVAIGDAMVMLNAQYWGKGQTSPIRRLTGIALKVGLVFGLFVLVLTALLPRHLLSLFTTDAAILAAGAEYLSVLKFSYLFYIVTTILIAFLRSLYFEHTVLCALIRNSKLCCTIKYKVFISDQSTCPDLRNVACLSIICNMWKCSLCRFCPLVWHPSIGQVAGNTCGVTSICLEWTVI